MMKDKKIKITVLLLFILTLIVTSISSAESQKYNYRPIAGYVPNEETAIKIAVAVWIPIYGKEIIEREKPYKAILKNEIWYVTGSLIEKKPGVEVAGGVAEAEIRKNDGKIIRVSHGK